MPPRMKEAFDDWSPILIVMSETSFWARPELYATVYCCDVIVVPAVVIMPLRALTLSVASTWPPACCTRASYGDGSMPAPRRSMAHTLAPDELTDERPCGSSFGLTLSLSPTASTMLG